MLWQGMEIVFILQKRWQLSGSTAYGSISGTVTYLEVMKFFMFGPSSAPLRCYIQTIEWERQEEAEANVTAEQKPLSSTCDSDLVSVKASKQTLCIKRPL